MRSDGKLLKWMFWFLAIAIASQFYVVQELLAAFALFAVGFCALAFVVLSLCLLQQGWEIAVVRIFDGERWMAGQPLGVGWLGKARLGQSQRRS
jgi:hypothetical protein